ncbi:flagellar motor protein MotB [Erwinia sp. HR93]|uniref:flagellar motor protein MotB n=1 Tax=Erwinia sp. HR93 TaxID=3094840 RepID=UPI002ADEA94B|nr:flagellar motor protein MotB [Erwinia sp. HR93]MEA1062415.1 flagellar motor protein MotB [Erwinia sp. HR93]
MKKPHVIIIKKKRKSHGHGHHGGSWKIAYADFMTAMMAFFLVMWLLSTTTTTDRMQIAEYFRMPLKVALAKGDKSSLSSSVIPGGGDDFMKQDGEQFKKPQQLDDSDKRHRKEMNALRRLRERLDQLIKNDPRLKQLAPNLRITLLDDGLRILIIDSQRRPMFQLGSAKVEPYMRDILRALAPILNDIPNRLSISGHTDDLPFASGLAGYSNWELSTDRANASRRELIQGGLGPEKVLRIVGMADTMNLKNTQGDIAENRRITLLILTHDKEESILKENVDGDEVTIDGSTQSLQKSLSPEAATAQDAAAKTQPPAPVSVKAPAPAAQEKTAEPVKPSAETPKLSPAAPTPAGEPKAPDVSAPSEKQNAGAPAKQTNAAPPSRQD